MSIRGKLRIFSKGEKEVMELVNSNMDYVIKTAGHLSGLVCALKAHDHSNALSESKTMRDMESHADSMHQKAVEEISKGSFFGGIREDFLNILEEIDNVADAAKDASRVFSQRNIPNEVIDYMFKEDVSSFIEKLLETLNDLKEALAGLSEKDPKPRVIRLAQIVEQKEEEADDIRGKILDNLLRNEIRADALDIIMLKQFLEVSDNVADSAENASDELLVLISKGYV
jgi:predicted phosphate transport protein (TIGR00153 family)